MALGSIMNTATLTPTFDDEFNTFSASSTGTNTVWQTTLGSGARTLPANGEEEYYSDPSTGENPFSDQNGVLDITAQPGSNPLGLPYDSGAINTQESFSQTYGYFEIDAQMPAGQGLWPAFWLLPESGAWPPELDAFEVLGNDPSTLYFSTHSTVQATQGTTLNVANVSSGFNLYGVMWGPQTVDLYINNVEVASMPTPADMNVAMFMNVNLAVGGYWPGDPNSSTPFPANMLVNYVRAFAYPGTTAGALVQNSSNGSSAVTTTTSVASTTTASTPSTAATSVSSTTTAGTTAAPVLTTPGDPSVVAGTRGSVSGVSVTDSQSTGALSVVVSDSTGLLNTTATSGVTEQGEGSTSLTLTGSTAAVNAELATLTYSPTGSSGTDLIWVSAGDPGGPQGVSSPIEMTTIPGSSPAPTTTTSAPATSTSGTSTSAANATAPVVTTPDTLNVAAGSEGSVSGVSVADSQSTGSLSVVVSDSTGLLNATATNGVTEQGDGSTSLTLTGSTAAVNTALATLTYNASGSSGSDWLWVSASDPGGPQGVSNPIVVTTTAASSTVPSTTTPASSSGPSTTTSASAPSGTAPSGTSASTPSVTTPATLTLQSGGTAVLSGISVSAGQTTGNLTVMVSDSTGLLNTNATNGVAAQGEGSTTLSLTGTASAINTSLASLTDQSAATSGDWLWVSANPSDATTGPQGVEISPVVITNTAAAAAPTPTTSNTVSLSGVMLGIANIASFVTASLSDSGGLLGITASQGVTATGNGTNTLTLQGTVNAINADLASLTYSGPSGQTVSGSNDSLSIGVLGASGAMLNSVALPLFSGHLTT